PGHAPRRCEDPAGSTRTVPTTPTAGLAQYVAQDAGGDRDLSDLDLAVRNHAQDLFDALPAGSPGIHEGLDSGIWRNADMFGQHFAGSGSPQFPQVVEQAPMLPPFPLSGWG